jgi:hypothetical protein
LDLIISISSSPAPLFHSFKLHFIGLHEQGFSPSSFSSFLFFFFFVTQENRKKELARESSLTVDDKLHFGETDFTPVPHSNSELLEKKGSTLSLFLSLLPSFFILLPP